MGVSMKGASIAPGIFVREDSRAVDDDPGDEMAEQGDRPRRVEGIDRDHPVFGASARRRGGGPK
jgi:hypothetical protein